MSLKNKVIKSVFSNWAGLLISILVSFFLAPYVVHKLGNTFYGIWSIINQFTGYLYLFDLGIRESVIRYTAKYQSGENSKKLEDILKASFYIYLVIAAMCLLVTVLLAYVFTDVFDVDPELATQSGIAILFVGGTIAQVFIFNVFNGLLMGYQRYDIFNVVQIIGTLIRTLFFVIALEMGYGIVALSAIQFFVSLFTGFIMSRMALKLAATNGVYFSFKIPKFSALKSTLSKVYNYSVYVLINNIGQKIIFTTDAIVIGLFMPVASVTFYAIAGTLVDYLRRLSIISAEILNPLVSHYSANNDDEKIHYAMVTGAKLTLFIALPISATFVILGSNFIGLWMGPEFAKTSGEVLLILAVAQALSAPHQSVTSVLYGLNKHKTLAHFRIVEAIANLILSISLIHSYGIVGVALGTAIPHIILVSLVLPLYATRVVGIRFSTYLIQGYLRPIVAIVPFVFLCLYIKDNMLPESLLSFFLYIVIISLFYLLVSYVVIFTKDERGSLNRSLIGIYNRKFKK